MDMYDRQSAPHLLLVLVLVLLLLLVLLAHWRFRELPKSHHHRLLGEHGCMGHYTALTRASYPGPESAKLASSQVESTQSLLAPAASPQDSRAAQPDSLAGLAQRSLDTLKRGVMNPPVLYLYLALQTSSSVGRWATWATSCRVQA